MFRTDTQAKPGEVAITVDADGSTARVTPPHTTRGDMGIHDLQLATALFVAGSLADRLGTQVCVLDEGDHIYLIDDDPEMSGLIIHS
jgi:hypothetical protein